MKDHQPLDSVVLDMLYDHPEGFTHMSKHDYIKMLIEDIRYYRQQLGLPARSPLLLDPDVTT